MQYQALALAEQGADVTLVGLEGSPPAPEVQDHPRVSCHVLPDHGGSSERTFLPRAAWRAAVQAWRLFSALAWATPTPDLILAQSPPAVPTLVVVLAVARLREARLVIDWHNVGHRLLALKLGARHPVVRAYAWHERTAGRRGDAHLTVSRAMKDALERTWRLAPVGVVYDRPPARFAPLADDERRRARTTIAERCGLAGDPPFALLVNPTSWTADEDVDLLVDAVDRLEARAAREATSGFPTVLVLLTGRGPRRARYEARLATRTSRRVHLRTAWIDADDYPRVLAAADLGLSMHRSASGLDLPMKLADMRGAGLPACALDYGPVVAERFTEGVHGWLFKTSDELADRLFTLLAPTAGAQSPLDKIRRRLAAEPDLGWQAGWDAEARHILMPAT